MQDFTSHLTNDHRRRNPEADLGFSRGGGGEISRKTFKKFGDFFLGRPN